MKYSGANTTLESSAESINSYISLFLFETKKYVSFNIISRLLLCRSLNFSSFIIMYCLSFWFYLMTYKYNHESRNKNKQIQITIIEFSAFFYKLKLSNLMFYDYIEENNNNKRTSTKEKTKRFTNKIVDWKASLRKKYF